VRRGRVVPRLDLRFRRRGTAWPLRLCAALFFLTCSLAGCASLPPGSTRDPRDHVERFNRTMFKVNTALDHAILRPVAHGYVKVTPRPVRNGIANFLFNLGYTKTIINDMLQGRVRDLGNDLARFTVNTTIGIGGLLDPATHLGFERHERDFGQTLGKWGVHTGSYLVLPLLGPSDVRDAFGSIPDRFMTVDGLVNGTNLTVSLLVVRAVDDRAQLLSLDKTLENSFDPYAFVRSAWFQHRAYKLHEGYSDDVPDLPPLGPDGTK
jgi:phospholipid-binding lipoprotein MlaA